MTASARSSRLAQRRRRDATDRLDELLGEGERVVYAGEVARLRPVLFRVLWEQHGLLGVIKLATSVILVALVSVGLLWMGHVPELSIRRVVVLSFAFLFVTHSFFGAFSAFAIARSRRYFVTDRRLLVLQRESIFGDHVLQDELDLAGKSLEVQPRAVVLADRWRIEEPTDRAGLIEALRAAGASAEAGAARIG